jgi:hypothetical protein
MLSQITGSPSERKGGWERQGCVEEVPEHQGRIFFRKILWLDVGSTQTGSGVQWVSGIGSLEQDTVAIRSFGSLPVLGNRPRSCLLWRGKERKYSDSSRR